MDKVAGRRVELREEEMGEMKGQHLLRAVPPFSSGTPSLIDLAQVSVPRDSLKEMEGTPGRFPEEAVSRGRYLPWPLAPLPGSLGLWVPGINAQNSHHRHVAVSIDTGRTGRGVSWYPRATTAAGVSLGSQKAKAPPNLIPYPHSKFSGFSC